MNDDKAMSLHEQANHVERAFFEQFGRDEDVRVRDIYEDSLIAEWNMQCYRVAYTLNDDMTVSFPPRMEWMPVEREWIDMEMPVAVSGGLKAMGDGRIGGYLVLFSDAQTPDLTGDFFTRDTDFDFADGDPCTIYYQHGYDPTLKMRKLGKGTLRLDEEAGVWMEAQLALRDDYERALYLMVESGKMGLSSGTLPNLVSREPVGGAQFIKTWPIGKDASITPTPAEPRTFVRTLKSLLSAANAVDVSQRRAPEGTAVPAAQAHSARTAAILTTGTNEEEKTMEDKKTEGLETLKAQLDAQNTQLAALVALVEKSPALRSAGYVSDDGGGRDKHVKSLGDFLLAITRADVKRLETVYGSTKDVSGDTGASGGWLLPTEFAATILDFSFGQSAVLAGVTRIPVSARAGEMPALDVFAAPSAGTGASADAGRLTTAARAEGGTYTETQPQFEMINWRVSDAASGYVEVSKEMLADSPISIEALLRRLFGIAVQNKLEYLILSGSGAGEPLGILNAPAAIGIAADSANTWDFDDATEMYSRFQSITGSGVWLYHPSTFRDFAAMQVSANNAVTWVRDLQGRPVLDFLGYPMMKSQHLPQSDTSGHVLLADLGAYYLFERGGMYVDYSEHAAFLNGKGTWRFGMRVDGQPALKSAITLADPQGSYTVSPFVYNSD